MWIMLPDAFLSVVRHREREDRYLVRARRRVHLERFFHPPQVMHTPHADYPYRAEATQNDLRRIMVMALDGLTYPNFKSEAARRADRSLDYVRSLHDVWATMRSIEDHGARAVIPSGDGQPGTGQEHSQRAHHAREAGGRSPAQGRRTRRT